MHIFSSHYFDAMMKDFFRDNSQSCGDRDDSTSFAQGPMSQFDTVDNMVVDDSESLEEYDVFPDLAFLESINPQQQHFDFSFSMIGDQSSTPESNEYDIGSTQMAELRALLLETFPDGMPEEFDYESILADQHVPSDPLDPFLWNYFQSPIQTEDTPDEQ